MDRCEVWTVHSQTAEAGLPNRAPWWLVATDSAAFIITDSSFQGRSSAEGIINLQAEAEAILRGCNVTNLAFSDSISPFHLGIVNTSIAPAMSESFPHIRPPHCDRKVAAVPLCDPRAECTAGATGGVECHCRASGNGLRNKPGARDDGSQCEQDASLRAVLESESVSIAVAKPGSLTNRTLNLFIQARGETALTVVFNVTMTRIEASSGALTAANGTIRVDQPSMSAFGHHIDWTQLPPAATWHPDLDGSKFQFADTARHEFTVRLSCDRGEQGCATDGDIITTVLRLVSCQDECLQSQVKVDTTVEAMISCENSIAWVEGGVQSVLTGTPMRVHLRAFDVDNLPIPYTRAPLEFKFHKELLPVQWDRGSNSYIADISADLTQFSGEYALVVRVAADPGWRQGRQNAMPCELMRMTVKVESDSKQIIVAACLASVLVLSLGLLGYLMYRSRERSKALLLSFLNFEGFLIAELCLEAWVRCAFVPTDMGPGPLSQSC